MKKAVAKCCPKMLSLQLTTDEPWDTVTAQLLVKISQALNLKGFDYSNYTVMCFIPCILPKPGTPLQSDDDYSKCMSGKEQAISVVITENADKENKDPMKKQGKNLCICTLASRCH